MLCSTIFSLFSPDQFRPRRLKSGYQELRSNVTDIIDFCRTLCGRIHCISVLPQYKFIFSFYFIHRHLSDTSPLRLSAATTACGMLSCMFAYYCVCGWDDVYDYYRLVCPVPEIRWWSGCMNFPDRIADVEDVSRPKILNVLLGTREKLD